MLLTENNVHDRWRRDLPYYGKKQDRTNYDFGSQIFINFSFGEAYRLILPLKIDNKYQILLFTISHFICIDSILVLQTLY